MSQTEDYSPGDDLSVVLRNCSGGSLVFNTGLYQNKHQTGQGCIPARFQKRQINMYAESIYDPGVWERKLLFKGVLTLDP